MEKEKVHVDELLREGKPVQIELNGYSMYPFLVPGRDQVGIVPVGDEDKLKRGQVALYRREGSILVLHRIWKVKQDGYYMVGDKQKEIEGPLDRKQILGVMEYSICKGKKRSVRHPAYLLKSTVWLWLRPFRPFLSHMVAACKRKVRS